MLEEFKNALNWTINIEYEGTNIAEPNTKKNILKILWDQMDDKRLNMQFKSHILILV